MSRVVRFVLNRTLLSTQRSLQNSGQNLLKRGIISNPWPELKIPDTNYITHLLKDTDKYLDNTAIINSVTDERITYAGLTEAKQNIASGLVRRGAKPGFRICLFLPNCPEFILAKCGILEAGGTIVPINPKSTVDELTKQWSDARPQYVIAHTSNVDVAKAAAAEVKCVKDIFVIDGSSSGCRDFRELLEDDGGANPAGQWTLDWSKDLAFLPYSSGTTGLPKGVMLTHNNLNANLCMIRYIFPNLQEDIDDTYCGILPFFHIYPFANILGTSLNTKSPIVTIPRFDPETFLDIISRYKITELHIVPPLVQFMLQNPRTAQYDLTHIKQILCGAAPLDKSTIDALMSKLKKENNCNAEFIQGYGMTEGPIMTIVPWKEVRLPNKEDSVGLPMPNLKIMLTSPETGKEVEKPGEIGEICVKGPSITTGYFQKPEINKESFKDGWFLTGDVAYFDDDGYFYVVDRIKELIKFNAYQVAPAELEGIIREHPAVLDCAVIGKPDEKAGEVPVAFVVSKGEVLDTEIIDYVAEKVSDYKKLRGGVIFVKSIPKSESGKILRRQLKDYLV